MKHLSPLEKLIDLACGINSPAKYIDLICPTCKSSTHTRLCENDPVGSEKLVMDCPKCWSDKSYAGIAFLDGNGNKIGDWENITAI